MMDESDPALEAPVFDVWRCIGCGRIEAPQPCIGVCEDRKVRMVEFADYAAVVSRLDDATDTLGALQAVLRRITLTKPRDGQWERSYRALQAEARRTIVAMGRSLPAKDATAARDPADP
jgi:hypothetical protein